MDKLELVQFIVEAQANEADDEAGDKYIADPVLALEAISAALNGTDYHDNGALRQYVHYGIINAIQNAETA